MKVIRILVSVILAIVLTVSLILIGVLYFARNSVSKKTITKAIDSIDLATVPVSDFNINSQTLDEYELDDNSSLFELIASFINKNVPDAEVTIDQIKDFFNSNGVNQVKAFIEEKSGEYIDSFLSDNEEGKLEASEIIDLIRNLSDDIEKTTGIKLSEDNLSNLENKINDLELGMTSVSSIKDKVPVVGTIGKFLSVKSFRSSIILAAVLAVLILVINIRHIGTGLTTLAIPSLITGLLFLAFGGIMALITRVIKNMLSELPQFVQNLTDIISSKPLLIYGAVFIAAGILLSVAAAVIKKTVRKKEEE